jgi:SAM-dependent methyltransferase
MRNQELWQPSKFVFKDGVLRASRNTDEVHIGSRFSADLQAAVYQKTLAQYARGGLLDLGCGKVPLYAAYAPYVTNVTCIDWANTPHPSPYLDYEFNLNQQIPLAGDSFDTVLATDVVEHIANPSLLWQEMARLLKPAGRLIVTVPFLYGIHEMPHDYYRYTEFGLKYLCEQNALYVEHLEAYGGSPEVFINLFAKHLAFSRLLTQINLFFGSAFVRSRLGQKLSHATSYRYPLGYVLVASKPQAAEVTKKDSSEC